MIAHDLGISQEVNACTLTSVAVIRSVLEAAGIDAMKIAIVKAQKDSEQRYQALLASNQDQLGGGMLEMEVFKLYEEFFLEPHEQQWFKSATERDIRDLIEERDTYDNFIEFMTFTQERMDAIQAKLPSDVDVNWENVSAEDLIRLMNGAQTSSLHDRMQTLLENLEDETGVTIRIDGHTTSLVKRDNQYYAYDSLTGTLLVADNSAEMLAHMGTKIAPAQAIVVYDFKPKRLEEQLMSVQPTDLKPSLQQKNLEEQAVQKKLFAEFNAKYLQEKNVRDDRRAVVFNLFAANAMAFILCAIVLGLCIAFPPVGATAVITLFAIMTVVSLGATGYFWKEHHESFQKTAPMEEAERGMEHAREVLGRLKKGLSMQKQQQDKIQSSSARDGYFERRKREAVPEEASQNPESTVTSPRSTI